MKKYSIPNEGMTLITGTAAEVKAMYRSMEKAYVRSRTWLYPLYTDSPRITHSMLYPQALLSI